MDSYILVTYASKYGATAEIAEVIAETLRQAGLQTDLRPVEEIQSLAAYQVVVLGSALYMFRWLRPAVQFLETHQPDLVVRELWVFLSGPTSDEDEVLVEAWKPTRHMDTLLKAVGPRDLRVFRGAFRLKNLSGVTKWMMRRANAPEGDFRDWDRIRVWAECIAQVSKATGSKTG